MVVPLNEPHSGTSRLDRAGRQYFYWYPESEDADLADIEVQFGAGPWLPTTVREDPNGVLAPSLLIAGPDAALGAADVKLVNGGMVIARIVDTEIEVGRGRIDLK